MYSLRKWFSGVARQQCVEFGQAATLITLAGILYYRANGWVWLAFVLSLITLAVPVLLYPFAVVWFGLSKVLGRIMPPVVMGIVFFVLVTPVGLGRRLLGKDSLQLRQFKRGRHSVLRDRNHAYVAEDLSHSS